VTANWIVIDSCIDGITRKNAVLTYFEEISINPANAVRLVIATHAHDDHIAGISEIYEHSLSSFFVVPSAITPEEYAALILRDQATTAGLRKRIHREYARVAEIASSRPLPKPGLAPIMHATQGRELASDGTWRVLSLSPSDEAFRRALSALRQAKPAVGDLKVPSPVDPNELAIAVWIEIGQCSLLFGADLLCGPEKCGWEAVLSSFVPTNTASFFKVPHHGSPTAQHETVWSQLLAKDPIAVVTPYRPGRRPLPADEDLLQLKSKTQYLYTTAPTRSQGHLDRRTISARGAIETLGRHVREIVGPIGQVQARLKAGVQEWTVELRPPAERRT
jgi:hypothetical protein